jgi:hypothetical protein
MQKFVPDETGSFGGRTSTETSWTSLTFFFRQKFVPDEEPIDSAPSRNIFFVPTSDI